MTNAMRSFSTLATVVAIVALAPVPNRAFAACKRFPEGDICNGSTDADFGSDRKLVGQCPKGTPAYDWAHGTHYCLKAKGR
jgi:hypothetical protein